MRKKAKDARSKWELQQANERLRERNQDLTDRMIEAEELILKELEKHVPKALSGSMDGGNPLHPGNHRDSIQLFCAADSTSWPCRTMNTLNALYSTLNGYDVQPPLKPAYLTLERGD